MITLTVTPSTEEIVSGFPKTVTMTTDIHSTIFYTFDGTDPTAMSDIYVGPLAIPTNQSILVFKAFATDGISVSDIFSDVYRTNILNNTRLPHAGTTATPGVDQGNLYPFGTQSPQPNTVFTTNAGTSYVVNDSSLPQIANAFDVNGNNTVFTNKPYTVENYPITYTTVDDQGIPGRGIGTAPAGTVIIEATPIPTVTQSWSNTFDPRAQVIFQDASKERPGDPVQINSMYFSLENAETSRDGNAMTNSGGEGPSVTGSFVRAFINPRDNTITHYYYDNSVNRWIISKAPYVPSGNYDGNLAGAAAFGRGSSKVFEWAPFRGRHLF
jgi:Chitobiase/beta-hexosaminidase C-terminal domain